MRLDVEHIDPDLAYRLLTQSVVPRPIAFVTTLSPGGLVNAAPFSFFNAVDDDPPTICLSIAEREPGVPKHTLRNLRELGEFVVNVVDEELVAAANLCATDFPADVSEVEAVGLAVAPCAHVRPPRLAAAPISLECRLAQVLELDTVHTLVLGRVLAFHLRDGLLQEGGRIDPRAVRAVGRLGGALYCRTRDVFELRRLNYQTWLAQTAAGSAAADGLPALLPRLAAARRILVVTHQRPDPDAVGSALAAARLLRLAGKEVDCYLPDPVPGFLATFVQEPLASREQLAPPYDLVLAVDVASPELTDGAALAMGPVAVLDHHPQNPRFGAVNWVDAEAAACAEQVATLARQAGWTVDPVTATYLYIGLVGDTGRFAYANADGPALRLAADLVEQGAQPDAVARAFLAREPAYARLLKAALPHWVLDFPRQLSYLAVPQALWQEAGADSGLAGNLVEAIRGVQGLPYALLFVEDQDAIRVRLRSEERPIHLVAQAFGGGGHPLAAGIRLTGLPLEEAVTRVTDAVYRACVLGEPLAGAAPQEA